jgi:hypothetical protein
MEQKPRTNFQGPLPSQASELSLTWRFIAQLNQASSNTALHITCRFCCWYMQLASFDLPTQQWLLNAATGAGVDGPRLVPALVEIRAPKVAQVHSALSHV